jgi:hypothetical protein
MFVPPSFQGARWRKIAAKAMQRQDQLPDRAPAAARTAANPAIKGDHRQANDAIGSRLQLLGLLLI